MQGNNRWVYLDVAKGIGIILVVMSHTIEKFPFGTKLILSFFMPLFFIASGYVYTPNKRSKKENIIRRSKSILRPYITYNVIIYTVWLGKIFFSSERSIAKLQDYFRPIVGAIYSRYCLYVLGTKDNINLLTINNHPLWFLTCMFLSSVIFYMLVEHSLINKKYSIIINSSLILITYLFTKSNILFPWSLDCAFLGAFYMLAGAQIKNVHYIKKPFLKYCTILIGSIFWILLANWNGDVNMSVRYYGQKGIFSILVFCFTGVWGSFIIFEGSKRIQNNLLGKVLANLGKETIVILGLHAVILDFINKIFEKGSLVFQYDSCLYWIGAFVKVAIVLLICIGIKLLYSKGRAEILRCLSSHTPI